MGSFEIVRIVAQVSKCLMDWVEELMSHVYDLDYGGPGDLPYLIETWNSEIQSGYVGVALRAPLVDGQEYHVVVLEFEVWEKRLSESVLWQEAIGVYTDAAKAFRASTAIKEVLHKELKIPVILPAFEDGSVRVVQRSDFCCEDEIEGFSLRSVSVVQAIFEDV